MTFLAAPVPDWVLELGAVGGDVCGRLAVAVLKAADGYAYQACESAEWRGSLASALLGMVRTEAIRALPGYDDAPWTIGPADLNRLGGPTCRTCEARTAAAATPPAAPATVTRVRTRRGQLRLED